MRRGTTTRTVGSALAVAVLAAGLAAVPATARAQFYGGSPAGYGGFGGGYPAMGFGQVGFGQVGFPGGFGYGYGTGSPAFGYGGFGYGQGALSYGGLGYGGVGYSGNGVGPAWGVGGASLADIYLMKSQMYSMNAAQYNMMNAQAATAYQAANLLNQQATATLLDNYTGGKYSGQEGGGSMPATGSPGYGTGGTDAREPRGDIPFDQLFTRDGQVLWPLGAPNEGDLAARREAADRALGEAIRRFAENGRVPVRIAVEARNALGEYALPAAQQIKAERAADYDGWVNFVSSLDRGLRTMAGSAGAGTGAGAAAGADNTDRATTPVERAGPVGTRPEDAPKSAGDVLRETVGGGSTGDTPKTPPRDSTGDTPKTPPRDDNRGSEG